jgi:two-component system chemotaxis response regulator CheB
MVVRVLVVDDSRFFRRRVTEMLEGDSRIKVIGAAENGSEAVQKSGRLKPDVITMDIEMPVMDGITATKRILATQRIPILMFSSLTTEGAQATLDALDAGAVDFLPKRFEDISNDKDDAKRQLCNKVLEVVKQYQPVYRAPAVKTAPAASRTALRKEPASPRNAAASPLNKGQPPVNKGSFKFVVIGTSTGGPVALQNVLTKLPADFAVPILLVQHMPGSFTTAFAQRLNNACAINIKEAEDGDVLKPATAFLAPGGKQMELESRGNQYVVRIKESQQGQNYKPCVDITFDSVAKLDPAHTLAIIMTGMGADGCEGAKTLKRVGATIWAQDAASSVVYGMPAAVAEAGVVDHVLSLEDIGTNLAQRI